MTIRQLVAVGLAVAGLAASGSALAQSKLAGWYLGFGAGQTKSDIDNASIDASVRTVPGVVSSATTSDERDNGWKLFVGYQFHPNFAAELSYANLGRFSTLTKTTPAATLNGDVKIDTTWSADVLGIVPLSDRFSAFGRLGLLYSDTKASVFGRGPGGTVNLIDKDTDWNYKIGLGVGYEFTDRLGLRGEWERYRVADGTGGNADIDLWSLSLRFKF